MLFGDKLLVRQLHRDVVLDGSGVSMRGVHIEAGSRYLSSRSNMILAHEAIPPLHGHEAVMWSDWSSLRLGNKYTLSSLHPSAMCLPSLLRLGLLPRYEGLAVGGTNGQICKDLLRAQVDWDDISGLLRDLLLEFLIIR